MTAVRAGNVSNVPPPARELTTPAASDDSTSSAKSAYESGMTSRPPHQYAEVLVLLLQQPLVGVAELLRLDGVRHQPGQVHAVGGERPEQPPLGFVNVPGPGQPRVG